MSMISSLTTGIALAVVVTSTATGQNSRTIPTANAETQLVANADPAAGTADATPGSHAPGRSYTVQAGDSLFKIARENSCQVGDLLAANGLKMDAVIHPGQKIKLPVTAPETPAPQPAPPPSTTYRIAKGDTYYSLSRRLKLPLQDLVAANPQAKATELYEGRIINLPATKPSATTDTAPATDVPVTQETGIPEATPPAEAPAPGENAKDEPASEASSKIHAVKIEEEISYGDFAARHGTNVERLNSLNDLNLTSTTILAKGSELYVPAQP